MRPTDRFCWAGQHTAKRGEYQEAPPTTEKKATMPPAYPAGRRFHRGEERFKDSAGYAPGRKGSTPEQPRREKSGCIRAYGQ